MQRRDWAWLLVINAIANVAVEATFHEHSAQAPWFGVLAGAWPGFIVSTTISTLCLLIHPRLIGILSSRIGPWTRGAMLILTLVALALVGSALALAMLTVAGHLDGWRAFGSQLQETMKVAILVTLVFGIYTTVNEMLRVRLEQATLALRTKERDEAEARQIASQAQLASLESRVNPHFFFNTLNSIAELTREDAARAERMTTQLASLMRSSLDASSAPLVPLAQEVQSIRDYLDIEHVRFGDRLRYEIRLANDAGCALVPRLSLQTVVENSVKYAVSPRREGASVSIVARRQGEQVFVEVTDDGPGFEESTMPDGHGLALIRDRLALLYGQDARLSVSSRPGRTTVGIVVPASKADA
jgi:LytS/YehU family sensor histidine kinase